MSSSRGPEEKIPNNQSLITYRCRRESASTLENARNEDDIQRGHRFSVIQNSGVSTMKNEAELTEQQQLELQECRLNGEFDRRRLIRFGYLSVAERRRLREVYPDLEERFEPETDRLPLEKAFGIFIVYMIGFMIGAGNPENVTLIRWAIAIVLYWVFAVFQLRSWERIQGERNELYCEWRGYRSDRHGRKI
jgi:hypothetical protein